MTISSVPQLEYYYDYNGYYAYVMLNSTPELRDEVRTKLQRKRVKCPLWGSSKRPASNGRKYQWYIRVFNANEEKPKPDIIEQFFETTYHIYSENKRIMLLEQKIAQARQKSDVEAQKFAQELALFRKRAEELQGAERLALEIDEENKELRQHLANLECQNKILEEHINSLTQQRENDQENLLVLGEELKRYNEVPKHPSANADARQLLSVLLPNLEFEPDSSDPFKEFDDYEPTVEWLHKLACQPELVLGERTKTAPQWFEIPDHISTGQNNNGRIYYQRQNGKCRVYIDLKRDKKHQDQVLKKLNKR